MAHIQVKDTSPSDLREDYKRFWTEMYPAVARAVEDSFLSKNMRHPTQAEVKRRISLAKELVDEMRQTFRWSKSRIRDNVSQALQAKLDGLVIDLDTLGKRSSW